MKHTLKDFENYYLPRFIQIIVGEHIINIDTKVKGSAFIIKHFYNETFTFISFENNFLILKA